MRLNHDGKTSNRKRVSSLEVLLGSKKRSSAVRWVPLREGVVCPHCKEGRLAYNGILALECPNCGFVIGEGGGCT